MKSNRNNKKNHRAPSPVKMNYYQMGFEGASGMTFEERLQAVRTIGEKAESQFPSKYLDLQKWFKSYDQLNFLSFCYYYFMTSEAGYDEEAEKGGLEFPPHYQELMQAFALTLPRFYDARPFSEEVYRFKEEFKLIGELSKLKYFNFPDSIVTESELESHMLRVEVMMHTTAVRNWSYEHQMKAKTIALAQLISEPFKKIHGFDPVAFLEVIYSMPEIVEARINEHRSKTFEFAKASTYQEVFTTYDALFPVDSASDQQREEMWKRFKNNLTHLKAFLLMHSDMFLHDLFTFSYKDLAAISEGRIPIEKLRETMSKISFGFGDLQDREFEHFLLGNPVHESPFIQLDDGIFSTMWSVLTHLSIGLLEKFCAEDDSLRHKYNEVRAKYLESSIEQLFKSAFPNAQVLAGSKWRGSDGKLYENDLLVIVDSFALVVEAKSGQVSPPAKRGAKDRLFKTLKELVEQPSEQAIRFIDFLKNNPGKLSLAVEKGPNNVFDAGVLKYFIPIGVTFSHLGMTSTNLKRLIKAGVTDKKLEELAPSINLTDLEVVFDLLTLQMEKIHYFQRRRELQSEIDFLGDEHDLLAWYLETGFNVDKNNKIGLYNMTLKSKELDNYIIGSAQGEEVRKPTLLLTPWWRDILVNLEEKQCGNWGESSYILLNFDIARQKYFEKDAQRLKKDMLSKNEAAPHNWISLEASDRERNFIVSAYYYEDIVADEREEVVEEIIEEHAQAANKGILVIGTNIEKVRYPFNLLGSLLSADLFGHQFLGMVKKDGA